jgi:proteic killer suppression protein
VIASFKDPEARLIYSTGKSRKLGAIARVAARRLGTIAFAKAINDLRNPPGNRLEQLKGDREGQYSIRINNQYRVCFRWSGREAHDVEIVDYH